MSGALVKICGVTTPEDARLAAECGAWAVGFIFAPGSPRRLGLEEARRAAGAVPDGVLRVGVFAGQGLGEIEAAREAAGLDLVQLHGGEPPELVEAAGFERCVYAVSLESEADAERAAALPARRLLVDRPRGSAGPRGGPPAWGPARRLCALRPETWLAGGLTPENVAAAVRAVRPAAVDVASGVERRPGVKDPELVRRFVREARAALAAGGEA